MLKSKAANIIAENHATKSAETRAAKLPISGPHNKPLRRESGSGEKIYDMTYLNRYLSSNIRLSDLSREGPIYPQESSEVAKLKYCYEGACVEAAHLQAHGTRWSHSPSLKETCCHVAAVRLCDSSPYT